MNLDDLRASLDELAGPAEPLDGSVVRDLHRRGRRRQHLRRGLVAGAVVVVLVAGGGLVVESRDAPTAVRVQTPATTATTLAPVTAQSGVTAIGDSVMLGAANQLIDTIDPVFATPTDPHVTTVDAAESRQFDAGVDNIQQRKDDGTLGQIVIVQLGTNGIIDPADLDHLLQGLSDRAEVVLVNLKVPRSWEQANNETLAAGAAKYENTVLLDWHDYADAHPEFFYDDGIHLRPEGAQAYAEFIAAGLHGRTTGPDVTTTTTPADDSGSSPPSEPAPSSVPDTTQVPRTIPRSDAPSDSTHGVEVPNVVGQSRTDAEAVLARRSASP